MAFRVRHIESDNVNSSICVVSSIALVAAAIFVLIKLGEYAVAQIVSMF